MLMLQAVRPTYTGAVPPHREVYWNSMIVWPSANNAPPELFGK